MDLGAAPLRWSVQLQVCGVQSDHGRVPLGGRRRSHHHGMQVICGHVCARMVQVAEEPTPAFVRGNWDDTNATEVLSVVMAGEDVPSALPADSMVLIQREVGLLVH